jgi:hypothetical protein
MPDSEIDPRRTRLAEACARLDPDEEQALAEEGIAADLACPAYDAPDVDTDTDSA